MKVLVVCSGNICRSPMAAAVLRDRLDRAGRTDVAVASAGTLGIVGETADPLAVQAAAEAGYDISGHRSAALDSAALEGVDLVLAMEEAHLRRAGRLGARLPPAHLLGAFLPEPARTPEGGEIEDPMGEGIAAFRACLRTIEAAVDGLVSSWSGAEPPAPGSGSEQRYFSEVTERILAARGEGAGLSSLEFHIVDGWWQRGIPLWLILEAAGEAALEWPDGKAPRGFVRRLAREVERRVEEAGLPSGERDGETGEAPSRRRDRLVAAIRAAARRIGPAHPSLHDALRVIERDLKKAPGTEGGLDEEIRKGRRALAKAARESLPLGAIEDIEREERARLGALGARLSRGAEAATLQRLVERRLLAYFDLPSLDTFDADPA